MQIRSVLLKIPTLLPLLSQLRQIDDGLGVCLGAMCSRCNDLVAIIRDHGSASVGLVGDDHGDMPLTYNIEDVVLHFFASPIVPNEHLITLQ